MLPTIIILKRSSSTAANCQFPLPRNLFLDRQRQNKSQAAWKIQRSPDRKSPPKQPAFKFKSRNHLNFHEQIHNSKCVRSTFYLAPLLGIPFVGSRRTRISIEFRNVSRVDAPIFHSTGRKGKQTSRGAVLFDRRRDVSMINPLPPPSVHRDIYIFSTRESRECEISTTSSTIDRGGGNRGCQSTRFWIKVWLKVIVSSNDRSSLPLAPFWRRIKRSFLRGRAMKSSISKQWHL